MNTLALSSISAVLIGLGATLTFDLWGLFLKYAFKIAPSNICLVGRWLRYMPDGTFRHANIVAVPGKSAECMVGWMAHYLIGITFASVFIAIVGNPWLQRPTPIPAIVFGVITVLAPFFIMQPSFGFGWAASKTSNPMQARIRSLMNHAAFGVGVYFFGWLISWLLWSNT
jgi:hypothetical protein